MIHTPDEEIQRCHVKLLKPYVPPHSQVLGKDVDSKSVAYASDRKIVTSTRSFESDVGSYEDSKVPSEPVLTWRLDNSSYLISVEALVRLSEIQIKPMRIDHSLVWDIPSCPRLIEHGRCLLLFTQIQSTPTELLCSGKRGSGPNLVVTVLDPSGALFIAGRCDG